MQELQSLQNIFKDRIFKIPDYQRGYAWTTRQLKDFWEDVVNLPTDRLHYTGLLSLKRLTKGQYANWNEERWLIEDRGYRPFHIVDGQQRLTTFVIFIQAVTELVAEQKMNTGLRDEDIYLGSFNLKQIKEAYLLIEKPPQRIVKSYKFGYETDNPSFRFLRHRVFMEPASGSIQETFYTLNLENSKNFFKENLDEYIKEHGLEEVEMLFKKLTQNLMFNVYEISDDFDVFVAFETMNNRGKKLSNLELLKNRLIYLTTLYGENELGEDERIALRSRINEAWKEIYYQLGRNKNHPLNDDDFLVAHWIMYFPYTREKGDDYIRFLLEQKFTPQNIYSKTEVRLESIQEFEELREGEDSESDEEDEKSTNLGSNFQSKLTPKEIELYVNSLKDAALHWYNTFHPVNNSDLTPSESLWLDRLNRIGIIYFRPLVTVSFLNENVTPKQRVRLFTAIERFIFVAFRLGRTISTYRNSEYYRAAKKLRENKLDIPQIVESMESRVSWSFYTEEDSGITFYDHSHFKSYIQKKYNTGSGFYGWNGLRYFLYEYEMEKVRQRGSQKIDWKLFVKGDKDKLSIEHIYPQTPENKCWKQAFKGLKKKEKEYLQGSLGNLLPLSQGINSSLQNDCFEDKKKPKFNERKNKIRQGYSDGSHSEIEVSLYDDWNHETILDRGIKLLRFMEQRWDLKFEDTWVMCDLLFLDFMYDNHADKSLF